MDARHWKPSHRMPGRLDEATVRVGLRERGWRTCLRFGGWVVLDGERVVARGTNPLVAYGKAIRAEPASA